MPPRIALALPLAAVVLTGCGSAAPDHPVAAQKTAASCGTWDNPCATPSASQPADALSTRQTRFVNALSDWFAAKNETSSWSNQRIARTGETICRALRGGAAPGTIGTTGTVREIVTLSQRYLCPGQKRHVLVRMSGRDDDNSAPFPVTSSQVTVRYSYDCSSFGQAGNFIVDLETAGGGDDQSVADGLSMGAHATTTVYPEDQGALYHVEVDSDCSWKLTAWTG